MSQWLSNALSGLRNRFAVQLYASRLASFVAVALLAFASVHFAQNTRTAADYLFSNGVAPLREIFELEMLFERHRRIVESAPAELDRSRLQSSRAAMDEIELEIGRVIRDHGPRGERPLDGSFDELVRTGSKVLRLSENFSQDEALRAAQGPYATAAELIDRELLAARDARLATLDRELGGLADAAGRLTFWVGAGAAVALLLIGPIGLLIKFRILNRLNRLTSVILRLGRNKTDVVVPFLSGLDEFGELARAIEVFKRNAVDLAGAHLSLDAALNNMSQGLCMFSATEELVVWNDRFVELYGLDRKALAQGLPLARVFELIFPDEFVDPAKRARLYEHYRQSRPRSGMHQYRYNSRDGRVVAVWQRAMTNGGWVDTHDDVTQALKVEKKMIHMAHHDGLTDLPNRFKFRSDLEAVLRNRGSGAAALLCLDLDGFKNVNDTFGHAEGDALLIQVAARLRAHVRFPSILCRLGGDEFAVFVPELRHVEDASAMATELIEELCRPYELDRHEAVVGASIGIALVPEHGEDVDQVLKHADLAMYAAKAAGRRTFRCFEPEMDERVQARQLLELDMRAAIGTDQFEVYYQPSLDVDSAEIRGFEALLRWRHPVRGMVSPAEFIPVAEETGLIHELGRWVLFQACREAATWPRTVRVAVNLSAVQFRDSHLVDQVFCALAEAGLEPSRLELEITESVILEESGAALDALQKIRGFGVKIAMDDFGTGYSSLSYLRRFPFDKIKIDQAFIRATPASQDAVSIVRAIIALGASLEMEVTAEGVETSEQLALLKEDECDEAQGYLFSPAVPAAKISSLLAQPLQGARSTAA